MTVYIIHTNTLYTSVRHLKKNGYRSVPIRHMPAGLSCENAQTALIWVQIWNYPLLSLCISRLICSPDF